MANVLVLANETIGGAALLDAIRDRHAEGGARFHVVVPQSRPRHGAVIYDEAVRDSAQVRVDLALAFMSDEGIEGTGEVGDADPFNAATDAIGAHGIDEIIISTLPAVTSGWLRRDLPERLENETGLPVKHIVVDVDSEGLPFDVTLVLANQTAAGKELVDHLRKLADEGPHRFIVVVPQDSGDGRAVRAARERLGKLLESLDAEDIVAAGMIGDPDPFTAALNALQYFHISEVVVSTLPSNRSQWVEKGLIDKLQREGGTPVQHVESSTEPAGAGT
ncbi:MAG TPA: hypothetical protein VEX67_06165 [Solirubrobacteraceae bacterium]|nr:hypothetical protein [Solirubrobacteraceae bacterium]